MATNVKKLFTLKNLPNITSARKKDPEDKTQKETRKRTYHEAGYEECKVNNGAYTTLSICLNAIHAKFQNEEKDNQHKQEELKKPYKEEQNKKETELKGLNVSLENKLEEISRENKNIAEADNKIENLRFEMNDIPQNPEKYGIDAKRGASVKFWIGLLLLLPITLYLFTFYISTSYSAFFKSFDIDSDIIESILDAQAFTKAWNDGPIEGAFVTLIPFVFLGLGYLIHMFGENKNWINYLKIALLIITTFIFDAILAYQIENKLYNLNRTLDSPEFNLSIAFTKVEFWGIIFAGFIVYIIWGLVFDFVMKEHRERDKIKLAQDKRNQDIKVLEKRIDSLKYIKKEIESEVASIKEKIGKVNGRIGELQNHIDGIIIPTKEYILYASQYMQGWLTYIEEKISLSEDVKANLVQNCTKVYANHLDDVGASNGNQNTIYRSVV